jgi:rhamnose transport system permease protein
MIRTFFVRYQREIAAALALTLLLSVVAVAAPAFYTLDNLRDLGLNLLPILTAAIGMTLVILTGQIDISIGAQFAVCSVATGLLSKVGVPTLVILPMIAFLGGLIGAINGGLVAKLKIPSIVATLAMMVALRDGLRWMTEGQWVQGLPRTFQWFGLRQPIGQALIAAIVLSIFCFFLWGLKHLSAGRAIYAVGSDAEAARLAGISSERVLLGVFIALGALTAIAATLNSARFSEVQGNAGTGLELRAIAAVVVGGVSINGGRGTLIGTLIGVALLGVIGAALTFLGVNPFWEKAIQGAIILTAIASDAIISRTQTYGAIQFARH